LDECLSFFHDILNLPLEICEYLCYNRNIKITK
jgi:hypothetical protein